MTDRASRPHSLRCISRRALPELPYLCTICICALGLLLFAGAPARGQSQEADLHLTEIGELADVDPGARYVQPLAVRSLSSKLRKVISLHVDNVMLEQALRRIAAEGGLKLIYGSHPVLTERRVTLHLESVTAREALEEAIRGTNLRLIPSSSGRLVLANRSAVAGSLKVKVPLRIQAQTGTITGTVTNASTGETLPGVNVVIEGTTLGAATDASGTYTITGVEPGTYTVTASFIGYGDETEEGVQVEEGQTVIVDFTMQTAAAGLDEIVVVGYGEQQRRDVTGAISSIGAAEIEEAPVESVEDVLQGRVAGVQVRQSGGGPRGDFSVQIRGVGSTGNTSPLYVVDGVPLFSGSLEMIDPSNIASIEVLKDASATAIYGARAANGVVLITTKSGGLGETRVSFSASAGVREPSKTIDMMNGEEFAELFVDGYENDGLPVPEQAQDPSFPQVSHNWQELIFRPAPVQEYNLSVTGGSDDTQFFVSGSYRDREGIVINSDFRAINLRTNVDHQVSDWLNVGLRLAGSREKFNGLRTNTEFSTPIRTALTMKPWAPHKNEEGEFLPIPRGSGIYFGQVDNPVAMAVRNTRDQTRNRFLGNVFAELDLAEGLQLRSSFGTDLLNSGVYFYRPLWPQGGSWARTRSGSVTQTDREALNWVTDHTLTYSRLFGELHNFEGQLGFSAQQLRVNNHLVRADGTTLNSLNQLSNQPNVRSASGREVTSGLLSSFVRVNYDYSDKYLLTVTGRLDGSSRFGPGNRFGTFPSASLGWRISEEPFMSSVDFIDDLKLRLSYGLTGDQSIGNFGFLARASSDFYVWGDEVAIGNAPASFANPDLQWESNAQFDVGLDLTVLGERLSLTADYYNKVSRDLLIAIPLAPSNGIATSQSVNLGSIRNRGFEFGLNATVLERPINWTTNFNISTNDNEVLDIGQNVQGEDLKIFGRSIAVVGAPGNLTTAGHPVGAFYGYIWDGIWQLDEAEQAAARGVEPGDARLRDLNGDGQITGADRTFLGQPQPKVYGGLTNTFRYKNLSLSVFMNWQTGHKLLNVERMYTENGNNNLNQRQVMVDRWTPDNPSNKYAKAHRNAANSFFHTALPSTHWLEDASFLRINRISLGYRLPSRWLSSLRLEQARITFSTANPFTFTSYSGFDPEASSSESPLSAGLDITPYPMHRSYRLRLDLSF